MTDKKAVYKVVVSEKAAEMLLQHLRFVAVVGRQAAEKFRKEVMQATMNLQSMPLRNPWLEHEALPIQKYRKHLTNKRYLLIYQVKDTTVYVEYVLDCRQDYRWLL